MEEEFVDDAKKLDGSISHENVKDAIDTREALGPLVTHPGWLKVLEMAQAQIDQRMVQIRVPAMSQDEAFAREGLINEVNGIEFFIKLPTLLLSNAQEIIDAYEAQSRAEAEAAEEFDEMEEDNE